MLLQDHRAYFTVNGSYFLFDPIFRANQTPTFPENHLWNQFEAKTNGALQQSQYLKAHTAGYNHFEWDDGRKEENLPSKLGIPPTF